MLLTLLLLAGLAAPPQPASAPLHATLPDHCLAVPPVGRSDRSPIRTDPIEYQIVTGAWKTPTEGEKVRRANGAEVAWTRVPAASDGVYRSPQLRGGYADLMIDAPATETAILDVTGCGMLYVNGEPRVGDVYGTGWTRLPIRLHSGKNELLCQGGRTGELKLKLERATAAALFNPRDLTLPDLRQGEKQTVLGGILVLNTAEAPLTDLEIRAGSVRSAVPVVPPLSFRKVPFRMDGHSKPGVDKIDIPVTLRRHGKSLDRTNVTLRVRKPEQTYKRTFISDIDGSVQYYAVNPARAAGKDTALVLTLHGASVEAIGQADAYEAKTWAHLVAPTNRRPYGFDWEDWGRLDALEVLEHARKELGTDPQRTYLTGHSMGGHGTWQIGVQYPDRFAAIGPSAGWISFWSYGAGPRRAPANPLEELLQRCANPSDTLALFRNYLQEGVYVLHGGADENVPVSQAREMVKRLGEFHHDFVYHEQPGAGHWWDASDEPGADCVDWVPMFDLFARHALPNPGSVREIEFVTADPGVSARDCWLTIEAQIRRLAVSSVHVRFDPGKRRFTGTTTNVARLAFDTKALGLSGACSVELDGQKLETDAGATLVLARTDEKWSVAKPAGPDQQTPERCGPFKQAFRNHVVFVYGTKGSAEENAWSYAKARFDAESFWYRGNGGIEVVADTAFSAARDKDRSVILYGNADTNGAWASLLGDSPVQVTRGRMRVGSRELTGSDLAGLFVRPRPGSGVATVGVVGGTGPAGMRLTDRQPYFVSGAAYPDVFVAAPETLLTGLPGIRLAGFFGQDWAVPSGEWVPRD